MTKEQKYEALKNVYTTMTRDNGEEIHIFRETTPKEIQEFLLEEQRKLDVGFDASYEIMSEACDIITDLTIEQLENENTLDLYAEADSRANPYTSVQLSYLNVHNEDEISSLIKDEAIESIAQACGAWHTQKVENACNVLREYILA